METTNPDRQRTVTLINQKGGCGKTTTTANLGAALARLGAKVLLIDADMINSLTTGYMGISDKPPGITRLIDPYAPAGHARTEIITAPDVWQPSDDRPYARGGSLLPGGRVDLIPGHPRLQALLETIASKEVLYTDLLTDGGEPGWEQVLAYSLSGVARDYDAVLIDAAGNASEAAWAALYASAWALTTFMPSQMVYDNTVRHLAALEAAGRNFDQYPRHVGVLCSHYDARDTLTQGATLTQLRAHMDTRETKLPHVTGRAPLPGLPGYTLGAVLPQVIPTRSAVKAAESMRAPVYRYRKTSAGQELGDLYSQLGIVILRLTNPRLAKKITTHLTAHPEPGVWPLSTWSDFDHKPEGGNDA